MTPAEYYENAIKALNDARQDYNNKLASINNVESSYQEIITMLGIVIANNGLLETKLNDTQKQLDEALKETDEKFNAFVGSIAPFSTPEAPEGWLECNGQEVDRQKYIKLFNIIGETFGKGDGKTTFKLPDLRGQFVRGWDQSGERDFASFQSDQIQTHGHNDAGHTHDSEPHEHSLTTSTAGEHSNHLVIGEYRAGSNYSYRERSDRMTVRDAYYNGGSHYHSGKTNSIITTINTAYSNITEPTQASHGAKTRPKNIALLYCIKY
jgi:microcystin-dependent protein